MLHPTDAIDTVVLVDGLGRVRQTKKDAVNAAGTTTRILSGRTTFESGRPGLPGRLPDLRSGQRPDRVHPVPHRPLREDVPVRRARARAHNPDAGQQRRGHRARRRQGGDDEVLVRPEDPRRPHAAREDRRGSVGKIRTQYLSPRGEILAVSEQNRLGTSNTLTTLTTRYTYDRLLQLTPGEDSTRNAANLTTAQLRQPRQHGPAQVARLRADRVALRPFRKAGRERDREPARQESARQLHVRIQPPEDDRLSAGDGVPGGDGSGDVHVRNEPARPGALTGTSRAVSRW